MSESPTTLRALTDEFLETEARIKLGGGPKAIERQHAKGRLTARERIEKLIDEGSHFQELGLWAAFEMYAEAGGAPGAGVVVGMGSVHGKKHMIIANDATVKAGAFFPMTCKKIIRAQTMAHMARLPLLYLVDSAGVYLPMQEDVFPDTDDFGRIFRNNAKISADGIPQLAAIMGFCVAGGGYLPVMCDTLLMTEGSGLYLAGQALVKAAIGQDVSDEELGGAEMHASISGTIDFKEPDDDACIQRLRSLVAKYPDSNLEEITESHVQAYRDAGDVYEVFTDKPGQQYDVKDIIACVVDSRAVPNAEGHKTLEPDFDEYKATYGESVVCGYATIGGMPVGIVANQGKLTTRQMPGGKAGPSKASSMPRVIYDDSADKSARFIMDCNQRKVPIVFLHDTTGFMVGRDSEQGGIIRSGAKMVNAMSNCVVPKIVVITGGSFGAGNYAMCGRAFDQFIAMAWPGSKCAVMGAGSATGTLAMIEERSRARKGEEIDAETHKAILDAVRDSYNEQQDIRHGAARGWVDRIIEPHRTREELIEALRAANQGWDYSVEFKTGVLQV
ncbi:MAG: methylcrotonoyl-CoA carboxylase [Phycisphaerae bacterium]|nr:methylcrotonoyl-CoA carboxylase [Phycisphaerae bacterium]MBM92135.1 methylcrotonoyl-CoA carboxylase [Phycisphaerae bacterium]HCT45236.1 methylcrotonoyl-CoA carboxylase [Phycisphaerales bacterium]